MDSVFDNGVWSPHLFVAVEVDLQLHALLAGGFRNISHKKNLADDCRY